MGQFFNVLIKKSVLTLFCYHSVFFLVIFNLADNVSPFFNLTQSATNLQQYRSIAYCVNACSVEFCILHGSCGESMSLLNHNKWPYMITTNDFKNLGSFVVFRLCKAVIIFAKLALCFYNKHYNLQKIMQPLFPKGQTLAKPLKNNYYFL